MKKTIGISLLYAALIFIILEIVFSAVKTEKMVHFGNREELNSFDFREDCAVLDEPLGDKYVNRLLSPQEIQTATCDPVETDFEHFVTYRFTVPVKDGFNYAITCKKSDYALNIFIDGVLVTQTGRVAASEADFVPKASAYEVFFTGKGESAEIIIQQANYNHHKHYPIWFRLGPAGMISEYIRKTLFESVIVAVILGTSSLMNAGMFFCFRRKRELLWFSIICFAAAVRTIFPEVTAYVAPDLNWYVSHKLEICSLIAAFFFSVLYVGALFREYVNKGFLKVAMSVSFIAFAFFALTPSSVYSRFNEVGLIIIAVTTLPMMVSMIAKMINHRKTIPSSNMLALIGVVFYALVSLNDAIGYGEYFQNLNIIGTTTGMAVFAFFNSLALSIDFRSSQDLLKKAEARERELDETNRMLLRLDRLRERFLSDLSHELKTPLTVIASNAAVSEKQVSMGKADEGTSVRLGNIEKEAVRLGKMVEKLKNTAMGQYSEKAENIDIGDLLRRAADFCMPLCARNGNTITVDCEDGIWAYSSANTMFHCLYNLISNATKHSRDGLIELKCMKNGDGVVISVIDHGEGMTEEQMEHAFERGFSEDSSTGIGLPLCRELIEYDGGTLFLSNTPGGGLTACFILKEGVKNGEDPDDRG